MFLLYLYVETQIDGLFSLSHYMGSIAYSLSLSPAHRPDILKYCSEIVSDYPKFSRGLAMYSAVVKHKFEN